MVSIYVLGLTIQIPELIMPILVIQNVIKDHPLSLKREKIVILQIASPI